MAKVRVQPGPDDATLGRLDELARLLRSGARFAAKAMVLAAVREGAAGAVEVRRLGPAGAEVAIPRDLFADNLRMIAELRSPPDPAPA